VLNNGRRWSRGPRHPSRRHEDQSESCQLTLCFIFRMDGASPPRVQRLSALLINQQQSYNMSEVVFKAWNTTQKHGSETRLRNTAQKHGSETRLRNTTQKHGSGTRFRNTAQKHDSETRLRNTTQKHGSETRLRNTAQKHDSETRLRNTETKDASPGG